MVIPSEIWDANITAKAMVLYGHITVLSNKKKYCYASNNYFEEVMKCSSSVIKRAIKELEDNQFIKREFVYKGDSKEIEERKIYLTTGMVKNEPSPMVKNEPRAMVSDDLDNTTRLNNTRNNSKLDVPSSDNVNKDFYGKIFFKIVEAYPKNRIGNRQHGLKKFNTLTKEEAKLAAINLKRYLAVAGTFVKSLQNYITEQCFTESWLQAEELNKKTKTNKDTKTFIQDYDNIS